MKFEVGQKVRIVHDFCKNHPCVNCKLQGRIVRIVGGSFHVQAEGRGNYGACIFGMEISLFLLMPNYFKQ